MRRFFVFACSFFAAAPVIAQHCNQSLETHVYHPNRLAVVDACKEVRGTLFDWRLEPDGDYHIQIKLDATQPDGEQVVSPIDPIAARDRLCGHLTR